MNEKRKKHKKMQFSNSDPYKIRVSKPLAEMYDGKMTETGVYKLHAVLCLHSLWILLDPRNSNRDSRLELGKTIRGFVHLLLQVSLSMKTNWGK